MDSEKRKLPIRRKLCLKCMVKMEDGGLSAEAAGDARFERCEECGYKSYVRDYILRKRKN